MPLAVKPLCLPLLNQASKWIFYTRTFFSAFWKKRSFLNEVKDQSFILKSGFKCPSGVLLILLLISPKLKMHKMEVDIQNEWSIFTFMPFILFRKSEIFVKMQICWRRESYFSFEQKPFLQGTLYFVSLSVICPG